MDENITEFEDNTTTTTSTAFDVDKGCKIIESNSTQGNNVAASPREAPPATPDQNSLLKQNRHAIIAAESSYESTSSIMTTPLMASDIPLSNINNVSSFTDRSEDCDHISRNLNSNDVDTSNLATLKHHLHILAYQRDVFQQELKYTVNMCDDILARERDECDRVVQQASNIACDLRDENIALMTENDMLKSRIEELEMLMESMKREHAKSNRHQDGNASHQEGNEQLIAVLQVEIADKERQLYKAHKARAAAEEAFNAVSHRAEMLAQQVEHLVRMLDREREKSRCVV